MAQYPSSVSYLAAQETTSVLVKTPMVKRETRVQQGQRSMPGVPVQPLNVLSSPLVVCFSQTHGAGGFEELKSCLSPATCGAQQGKGGGARTLLKKTDETVARLRVLV